MPHDHFKSVKAETHKARTLLVGTLMGGMLVISSFIVEFDFVAEILFQGGGIRDGAGVLQNPYSDLIALIGAVLLGAPLVWHAIKHLLEGQFHMDELVALAIGAAVALGHYQEAGVIAFFMIISNLIETRTALGARAAIESLLRITPQTAHRVRPDGGEEVVSAADLRPDDVVRVRPGDNIPADGRILSGESTVNQANITGESLPVDKAAGDEVFSGTSNLTGAMDIRVTKAGKDTTLGRVQKLILEAERSRSPLIRLIDRYAGWYTPTICMLAAIVVYFSDDWTVGVEKAIGMLIVACPCALVLATPTAMVAALSCAARLGVLIKNVVHLEYARSISAVILDKTGTLTTGKLFVTQMRPAPGVDGADLLKAAASAEQLSKHPVAQAVVEIARQARIALSSPAAGSFAEVAGRGVKAKVDGADVLVGRSTWLAQQGVDMSLLSDPQYQEVEGLSLLYVARGAKLLGWLALEDKTRPEAREAIDQMRALGVRNLSMVTGDKKSVAVRVAAEMGCTETHAEVLPADKLHLVEDLKKRGHRVLVVGDGVNDAPALAAGDLSVAMGAAGSDVAIESASIALMNNDLSRLPFLIRLSRQTTRVVWQNLIFGIVFIIIGQGLVVGNIVSPIAAAVLHMLATAVVIFNSARLVRFGEGQLRVDPGIPTTEAARRFATA
ncbi:MAG: cadmium-translocating P-type ATPase [Phycisphaerae bacterium]|nr:cadmium-translocating P-type ATPase [Planctomycetia bacterium]MCK6463850.1 cadmium-translocating P-type ATPase [Phycisphaerae bacterium]MCL4717435.1 cadmium-translocating P-type ATPase [Phycisphaerae bacterium]NUQ07578.1 cadmium-translocating P-type ATPase [Phycisphaerae bacterium]